MYDDAQKERVNAFDWQIGFPEVFARGGFDAVVGNPPYVKLQNFRTAHSDMADFLRFGRPSVHVNGYRSAQTGNFDLYLPFIERGLILLNPHGRLGYIAPSLWTLNEYGKGLRDLISKGQNLEGWIDFQAYQIFDEAINYTALQFFTNNRNDAIKVSTAPNGVIPERPWDRPGTSLPYGEHVFGDRWLLLTGQERTLINRLYKRCKRLDDPSYTTQIYQGLITSADAIYHLERIGPRRYLSTPKGDNAPPPYEVELEDEVMKPLVSGPESKRYIDPKTDTYLLFPYQRVNESVKLITPKEMARLFPKAWAYLKTYQTVLRAREAKTNQKGEIIDAPFDDKEWYRFGRHQNLDKQDIQKLIVAQTVPNLRVCFDQNATMYLNNVRVNGIVSSAGTDPLFLLGVLNSPVSDFVFRRIAKVKAGGFFEANKQFIAPLPIPPGNAAQRSSVADRARVLQVAHTARRDVVAELGKRLSTVKQRNRPETWLFPMLKSKKDLAQEAPAKLDEEAQGQWVEKEYGQALAAHYDAITTRLQPGADLEAEFSNGELSFLIDGIRVVSRIFVDEKEGNFIVAQWKVLASTFSITEKTDGKKLCAALRKLAVTDNAAIVSQIITLEGDLSRLESEIEQQETQINGSIYELYGFTEQEIAIIERGYRITN